MQGIGESATGQIGNTAGAVTGFFHAGITVTDMERSLPFYRDALGLEIEFDRFLDGDYLRDVLALRFDGIRAVYFRLPGGGFVELLEYKGIERSPASGRPCDPGAGHVCLYVDDIDVVTRRAFAHGYSARTAAPVAITSGPNAGARSIYLVDPDGYNVELFQRPEP